MNTYPLPPMPYPLPSNTHVVLCCKNHVWILFPLPGSLPYLAPYHPINSQRISSTSRDCKAAAFELDNKQLLRQPSLEIKNLRYYLLLQNTSFSQNLVLKFINKLRLCFATLCNTHTVCMQILPFQVSKEVLLIFASKKIWHYN